MGDLLLMKVTFGHTQGWGLVARRTNCVIKGLELSHSHPPTRLLGEAGREVRGWISQRPMASPVRTM